MGIIGECFNFNIGLVKAAFCDEDGGFRDFMPMLIFPQVPRRAGEEEI